jgi:hypothetical protein
VSALPVVEDLKVLEDGIGQLETGSPSLPVQELDLHPRLAEDLHGGVEVRPRPTAATDET